MKLLTVISIIIISIALFLSFSVSSRPIAVSFNQPNEFNSAQMANTTNVSKVLDTEGKTNLQNVVQAYDPRDTREDFPPSMDDNEGAPPPIPTEEEYFPDEQDIFSRKLFEKKLAPISKREKVIWAFRLSETNTFL